MRRAQLIAVTAAAVNALLYFLIGFAAAGHQ
jgi:hypothetical protein